MAEVTGGQWVLILRGEEAMIVQPYLIEDVGDEFEIQFVYGSGGMLISGSGYSVHATLEDAIRAFGSGTLEVTVHSEGEMRLRTRGYAPF